MEQTGKRNVDLSQTSPNNSIWYPFSKGLPLPIFSTVKDALGKYGLQKTAYLIIRNLLINIDKRRHVKFDKKYRIDTIGDVPIAHLDVMSVNKESGEGFYSTPFAILDRFFSVLPNDLSDYTFIDIGSGKGRILAYASQFNFKKIRGLEFAIDLHAICKKNIRAMQLIDGKCRDIESIHTDAADFQFPNENLVIFMFNPFRAKVMKEFLKNLEKHQTNFSKKVYIGYYNPRYGYLLERCNFLSPLSPEPPLLFISIQPHWPLAVFESKTSAGD